VVTTPVQGVILCQDMSEIVPSGFTSVRSGTRGRRYYYAYWRDGEGRHGLCLGPAHVRDSGRRTARGAIIWRAGDGPRPSTEHVTPKMAAERLTAILANAPRTIGQRATATLQDAVEGWMLERTSERGLKRSTTMDYEDLFERLYRDLGADTNVAQLEPGQLQRYFATFESQRIVGPERAAEARAADESVREIVVERWTAQPPASRPVEVETQAEAEQLAAELGGTWKHRAPGVYRVVAANHQRPRRVPRGQADELRKQGWLIERRAATRLMLCAPAATQTRNKYRDLLSSVLDYARRQGWIEKNPLTDVRRSSRRHDRERILRRDDFYDPDEVARLLECAPGPFEEAFWLCGFHAGMRLPGEALGLRWGAVDFDAGVVRIYDNWVRNAAEGTKTMDSAPVPMTPRLRSALAALMARRDFTGDDEFVFTRDGFGRPAAPRPLREAFKAAASAAGLKLIPMYNARHSFGTSLARNGVDVRTIQALMRHDRLSTTEQYMAYAPQPELAERISAALRPRSEQRHVAHSSAASLDLPAFLAKLDEEVPAKWSREVHRLLEQVSGAGS
jgi:integrase